MFGDSHEIVCRDSEALFLDQICPAGEHYFSLNLLLFSELILSWNRARDFMLFVNKLKNNRPKHLLILKSCLFQDCHCSVIVVLFRKQHSFSGGVPVSFVR